MSNKKTQQQPQAITPNQTLKFKLILAERKVKTNNGDVITYPKLVEVSNPQLIGLFKSNRPIAGSHVAKMASSISSLESILRYPLIIKIQDKCVWGDGQHLSQALMNLNVPIVCMIIEADSEIEALGIITRMNDSAKNWNLAQFIKSWVNYKKGYCILIDFKEKYHLTYSVIAELLTGLGSAEAKNLIKSGRFSALDMARGERRIQAIDNFHNKTGFLYNAYASKGLLSFIAWCGEERYYKIENKFLAVAKKLGEKRVMTDKKLGGRDDYQKFFADCFVEMNRQE